MGLQGFQSPQGRLCCTGALQILSATAPGKSYSSLQAFITDFDMSDTEVQLCHSNIILSYQDWFLGSVLPLSKQLQSTTVEHTSVQKILHDLQEFVFSASWAGYNDVNMSATSCSTRSCAREMPTCRTPSHACRTPSGSSSGHIFWMTPYSSVSRHMRLHSRLSPRL